MHTRIPVIICCALLTLSVPCRAAYDVTISAAGSSNGDWSGGTPDVWSPSGAGSNVSVADIQSRLATKSVTITTAGGAAVVADITVNSALSWSANSLWLNSPTGDIAINAVMTASGASTLNMTSGTTKTIRTGIFPGGGFAGRVDFLGRSGTGFLTINGLGYKVISSLGVVGSTTGTDLQGINGAPSGRYALGADIDASATSGWNSGSWFGFAPIGNIFVPPFNGMFDGLGHTVSNLYIKSNDPGMEIGLFSYTELGAVLRNVGLVNVNLLGVGSSNVGGLVGINNYGTISNVYATGSVSGNTNVGGLVGSSNSGSISGAYSGCSVSGGSATGGLVGYTYFYSAKNTISNAYATGNVTGTTDVGGLVGHALTDSAINNAYSTGSVSGTSNVGGLVGFLEVNSIIANSYAMGLVTGSSLSGGLVGYTDPIYNGTVDSGFWDTQTSGRSTSAGGTGKSTADMKKMGSFAGWSIADSGGSSADWRIYEGQSYPLLRGFLNPLAVTAKDATKIYDGIPYYDANGVTYAPSGYDAGKVLGTLTYSFNPSGGTNVGSYTITPGGLYSNQQGYDISFANGTLAIQPATATLDVGFAGAGGGKIESTAPDASINCLKGSPMACSAGFVVGTPITLKATSDWKSTFMGWNGGPGGTTNPVSFTLAVSSTVTAAFDPIIKVKLVPKDLLVPASLHASIQDACDALQADGEADILAQEYFFQEPQGVTIGRDSAKTITIAGGYRPDDGNYDTVTGMTSILGPLSIQSGRLNVRGVNLR